MKQAFENFRNLAVESQDLLGVRHLVELEKPPTALEFSRFVAANRPFVVRGGAQHWPAMEKWSNQYLTSVLGEEEVTVASTPNGYADAVVDDQYFVMPYETRKKFSEFVHELENKEGIQYIQSQNGNLNGDYRLLQEDVPEDIEWATSALDKKPDAVNFWMGDTRSTTSMHKDPYENIYVVIAGTKIFTLLPPTDYYCLHEKEFPAATWTKDDHGEFKIKPEVPETMVPWISLDPNNVDLQKFPRYRYAHPLVVHVNPGDMMYLPSMWYHHVAQREDLDGRVLAVNYWYDVEYGTPFTYFQFMTSTLKLLDSCCAEEEEQ
ncbi:hypothetical protein K493DRAFT_314303 [Basidiobolus meristosporus CBS 931.73]|uniref:JmjC domain-containing protein n=1 Tax=Basidiobolus meristosporus CBS 931.73 TaxID=1314790 RepID=A0A1Y1YFV0_9FUNG|nr:hypothetical protein K493DRAFT_314303 [Basidiobolus meristosporus CBS 931.73]|eukprot:ORX96867.1 hypothetical protein K493DRAFT_314303 [Basidiobolus meristosporus CBS 931.73]